MTSAKKLKKSIRSRAAKTGESYTSARRQVLEARRRKAARAGVPPIAAAAAPAPPRTSAGGRSPAAAAPRRPRGTTSDHRARAATGHGLDHWFAVLDAFDARAKGHTASARHLSEAYGVPGWHCQMITVEYERARGLRARNQSSRGDFQVSVSRTLAARAAEIASAFNDAARRRAWLRGADLPLARALETAFTGDTPRAVTFNKARIGGMRFRWDGGAVEIWISGKPGGKATVVASNTKLTSADEVERRRRAWAEALDGLKSFLAR